MSKFLLISLTLFALCTLGLVAACDDSSTDGDGDVDGDVDGDGDADGDGDGDGDADPSCTSDTQCQDSLYCNGDEICLPGHPDADDLGCLAGDAVDCDDGIDDTTDTCSEERGACLHECPDLDGDGHADAACVDEYGDPLGDDCDDTDADRYPGNVEVCDAEAHDEDCDLSTVGETDEDGDGFESSACCNRADVDGIEEEVCGPDCADDNGDINPDSTEFCDVAGVDEDCDGQVNEGLMVTCYYDLDDDGFAEAGATPVEECKVPGRDAVSYCPESRTDVEPTELANTDCDDLDPDVGPGSDEICDLADNDCDGELSALPGVLDESDRDDDGYVECRPVDLSDYDCADDDSRAFPGQMLFFTSPITVGAVPVARRYDYDCNGIEEQQYSSVGSCTPSWPSGCSGTAGWAGSTPACGHSASFLTGCSSACVPSVTSRTQACR